MLLLIYYVWLQCNAELVYGALMVMNQCIEKFEDLRQFENFVSNLECLLLYAYSEVDQSKKVGCIPMI